jgi:cell wall-associated NlpC family hydrolase
MPRNNDVIAEARKYLGVRWSHQGRDRLGIDCAGLILRVGNDLGLIDYTPPIYHRRTAGLEFLSHFSNNGLVEIGYPNRQHGDILLFEDGSFPCHCGLLVIEDGVEYLLHAHAPKKMVVEERITLTWINKLTNIFRFPY